MIYVVQVTGYLEVLELLVHTTPDCSNVIALFASSVSSCNIRSYDTDSLFSNEISIKPYFLVLL